jgi:Raf kinase inhibitor-like YbhB/YbcL family protein
MKRENIASTILLLVFIGIGGCLFQEQPEELSEASRTSLKISSSAFDHEGEIPDIYACDGVSPPLKFSNIPEDAKSLVLIMDDPDAKEVAGYTWVHWLVWNISPSITGIEEGSVPLDAREGKNGRGQNGYQGPCPPVGQTHRYFFKLYALDIVLDLPEGAIKTQLEDAMEGHILAEAELIGLYSRSASATQILFIGNSHTFFNDLPHMIAIRSVKRTFFSL